MLISLYVNNFLLAVSKQASLNWVKKTLKGEYNVKELEEIKTIIRWQVTWNISTTGIPTIKIDQSAFIHDLIE